MSIFVHLCEMFVGVRPCVALFWHYFVLTKSGKARSEIGAYYFQARSGALRVYLSGADSAKWENWRSDWVIATTEEHDRLILPTDPPATDRVHWRAAPFSGQGLP